jgi:hypothetical protein
MKVFIAQVTEIYEPVTAIAETAQGAARLALAQASEYLDLRDATDDEGNPWTVQTIIAHVGVNVTEVEIGTAWHDQHAGATYNDLTEI